MANYGYLSYSPYRDESQNGTEHYMTNFQTMALHQPNNPLLQDEEAFTRLAYKLLSEQNDSRQQGERVLETVMTAEERLIFSEAYQKKIKSLATFANPGESTLDGLLRRLRNAFGDSLLISKIPIQQRCLHSSPFKTKVEISEGCKGDENHHINGYIAYPHPTAQRGQFERIPTDLSKQSSIQENTHKSAVHQNFHLEKNSVERDPEVRSKNRDLISIRDIPITRDSSLDRRFCEYTPPSRRSRRSKSSRRGSKSPSRKSPDYLKPTPILKKGPDNKHSAKETMTKLIVQIPKSPRGTENSEIFEMIPPKPKQHERKLKKLHALQAESKTRQSIMEEIDRATILLSQSTDPENRVRYRFILDSLKLELENLTAASSVSSLTMSADSTRQGKRIEKKPLAPLLRAPEMRSSSPSRNEHFNETFSKKISRSKSPIPHDFNQRDELPVRPIFIEAREIPPAIMCDYKLMEDGDSGSVRSNDEIMAVEPSKQSEKTIQAIRGEDILSKQNALGEMQAIISEENMLSKEYALGRIQEKKIVGSEGSQNPTSMKVLSPGSFPEDYQFEAEVEGRAFTATVPKGGVSIGEVFESTVTDWRATKYQETGIPHHHWRDGLFDCFRHGIDHPALWTSFIFAPIALTQVMARMRLPVIGVRTQSIRSRMKVQTVLVLSLCFIALNVLLITIVAQTPKIPVKVFAAVVFLLFSTPVLFFCVNLIIRTRLSIRKAYEIPEENLEGCEDLLVSIWCSCCVIGQMMRHTADYDTFRAVWFSETGLPSHIEVVPPGYQGNDGTASISMSK